MIVETEYSKKRPALVRHRHPTCAAVVGMSMLVGNPWASGSGRTAQTPTQRYLASENLTAAKGRRAAIGAKESCGAAGAPTARGWPLEETILHEPDQPCKV
jgi:hypothetical protein